MANKQTIDQLDELATQVADELTTSANTADRIGQLLLKIIASFPTDFSPEKPYSANQWVIFNGRLVQAIQATLKGESPATTPLKWKDFVINTYDLLNAENASEYPITPSAFKAYLKQALKGITPGTYTGPDKASEAQINGLQDDTTFVTPRGLGLIMATINAMIDDLHLSKPGIHEVLTEGAVSTLGVTLDSFSRPIKNFVSGIRGFAVWKGYGANETIEIISGEQAKQLLSGQPETYVGAITVNTCAQLGGYNVNKSNYAIPATGRIYFDNTFVGNATATASNASVAATLGVPAGTLLSWVFDVPAAYKDNSIHTIELRHPTADVVLASVKSPGSCGITQIPAMVVVIDSQYEEQAAQPGVNPPPTVTNPRTNLVINWVGDWTITFENDEFTDIGDILTKTSTGWDSSKVVDVPSGVIINNSLSSIFIPGSFNTPFWIRRQAKDTANQVAAYTFLVTFNRNVNSQPIVIAEKVAGPVQMFEGATTDSVYYVEDELDNGQKVVYTGPIESVYFETPYPNLMMINPVAGQAGKYKTRVPDTIEKDSELIIVFKLPGNKLIKGVVQLVNSNSVANRVPVLNTPLQFTFATMGAPFSFPLNPTQSGVKHFTDPDGDPLTMSLQISNDGGITYTTTLPGWLSVNGGNYGGTPPNNGQSQYILKLRRIASDGRGGTAKDDFNLIVNNPTPAP